jgi:hypothetical protein
VGVVEKKSYKLSSLLWESLKKVPLSNELPIIFAKWREISADRTHWRAVCGHKILSATEIDTNLPTRNLG